MPAFSFRKANKAKGLSAGAVRALADDIEKAAVHVRSYELYTQDAASLKKSAYDRMTPEQKDDFLQMVRNSGPGNIVRFPQVKLSKDYILQNEPQNIPGEF